MATVRNLTCAAFRPEALKVHAPSQLGEGADNAYPFFFISPKKSHGKAIFIMSFIKCSWNLENNGNVFLMKN